VASFYYLLSSILRCVRWYCRYSLSYRDVEELTHERGLRVDHSTVFRWVQAYASQLDKRCRRYLRPTNHAWRVDEVSVQVKGEGRWLYRAVDKDGDTLDFLLTPKRDATAAKRFFRKTLNARNSTTPRVVNADKHKAYPPAFAVLQEDKLLPHRLSCNRTSTSTTWLNRTIAFSNDWSSQGWDSPSTQPGGPSKDTKRCTCYARDKWRSTQRGCASSTELHGSSIRRGCLSRVMTQEPLYLLHFLQQSRNKHRSVYLSKAASHDDIHLLTQNSWHTLRFCLSAFPFWFG